MLYCTLYPVYSKLISEIKNSARPLGAACSEILVFEKRKRNITTQRSKDAV